MVDSRLSAPSLLTRANVTAGTGVTTTGAGTVVRTPAVDAGAASWTFTPTSATSGLYVPTNSWTRPRYVGPMTFLVRAAAAASCTLRMGLDSGGGWTTGITLTPTPVVYAFTVTRTVGNSVWYVYNGVGAEVTFSRLGLYAGVITPEFWRLPEQ